MSKDRIRQLVEKGAIREGMSETGVTGVRLFRNTKPVHCAPAVYEPSIVAILSGAKEAILDGSRYCYDSSQYMCCTMSMPVEAGAPTASEDSPLLGVYISIDTRAMTALAIEMEGAGVTPRTTRGPLPRGVALAHWDEAFTDALLRLLQVGEDPTVSAVLGRGRLRELYYAVLQGEAGASVSRAFGAGNGIVRAIEYLSSHMDRLVTIDELASQVGMSRAVLHRKFKQATTMSPIQFMKSMRLNSAAMKIAEGMNVSEAAMEVGYKSSSQFSREFKRLYGQSPRQWSHSQKLTMQ